MSDLRELILTSITEIAPDAEVEGLDPHADIRDELDLDSMDELNLITRLSEQLGIDVPEADYPQLRTLDAAVAYLTTRLADRPG